MTNRHLSTAENHELCLIRFQQEIVLKAPGSFFFFRYYGVLESQSCIKYLVFFFYFYFLIFGIWYLDTSFCRYFDI